MVSIKKVRGAAIFIFLLIAANSCFADINNVGLFDTVLEKYATKAATWATIVEARATWLYWVLVMISMVWTFGFMALRRADLGEFFAEFIRFTITTGFFWWLLINGPNYAMGITNSMRTIAGNATGVGPGLSPSGIVDIGFDIFNKVLDNSSLWSPVSSAIGIILALIILVVLALIGVNMLLLLISAWILAYGGIFYLGFGGSRWTSEIALNYYKTVLGIAMQLFAMVLLVGIGKSVLDEFYTNMSGGIKFSEMAVLLIVAVILLMLVNKIPPMLAGIITGASVGGMGIGQFGAGAALGAAATAAAAAAVGGSMIAAGATQAAGGAQAVMAAISKAQENVAAGTDVLSSMGGGSGGSGGGGSETGGSSFAQAAGFAGNTSSLASATSLSGSDTSTNDTSVGGGSSPESSGVESTGGATTSTGGSTSGGQASKGGFSGAMAKAGRIVADASANLARGTGDVAKRKVGETIDAAKERISQTIGGQIASAIHERGNEAVFEENSLSATPGTEGTPSNDLAAEVAEFRDRDASTT